MRLLWTTDNIDLYRTFSAFLEKKKIEYLCEEKVERDWGKESYGNKTFLLWIYDEDDFDAAKKDLDNFLQDPKAEEFEKLDKTYAAPTSEKLPENLSNYIDHKLHHDIQPPQPETAKKNPPARLTTIILLVCAFLFLLTERQDKSFDEAPIQVQKMVVTTSDAKKALLYDYPERYELLDKVILSYGVDALAKPDELPKAGQFLLQEAASLPLWQGYYPYILSFANETYKKNQTPLEEQKLFEKEKAGELWRLFTPALLHNDLLHLFFNMIWLLLLSTQIEIRIGPSRLFIFMLVAALFTNTAQYLMSGPNFLGFSGIVCAQAFFIRMRQKVAPWEGYQMTGATFGFICFFISLLFFISFTGFILNAFFSSGFYLPIANTAHIVGALVGYLLGKSNFFVEQFSE